MHEAVDAVWRMTEQERFMQKKTLVGLVAAALAATVSAYTVYDGGKALRQNITSGSPVGANGETYTDENGGKWQYLRANDLYATNTTTFGKSVTSGIYRGIGGTSSRTGSPFIQLASGRMWKVYSVPSSFIS